MTDQVRRMRTAAVLCAVLAVALSALPVLAEYVPDPNAPRADIPKDYEWNPWAIFADDAAWEAELASFTTDIDSMTAYQGHLGDSADEMLACFKTLERLGYRARKLFTYANLIYDVDQSNSASIARLGKVRAVGPKFGAASSWVQPELLSLDESVVRGFMDENPQLAVYKFEYDELLRGKEFTLSAPEEKILSMTGNVRGVPSQTMSVLLNVDMKFPEIVDENGVRVPLTMSGWSKYRSDNVYNVRKQATDAFFGTLRKYENTLSTLLDGEVKSHILTKDARGYDSCLEAALFGDHISPTVYTNLINTINENLPRTLHKYVDLRRKVMHIDGPLTFPNLYNPLLGDFDKQYTYEEGEQLVLTGLNKLGKDYCSKLAVGMNPANGWTDVYPNLNKESGAYSNGGLARTIHPYVKQNYDNSLDAVSTLAHEFGHALHSVYSAENQPPVYSGYTTFLAEIASTCNEALLANYMLKQAKTPEEKLYLLNQRLESIRLTIFRQTLFAEFELRFHEHAEEGNALTPEFLNGLYGDLIKTYYGPDFELGPDDECEWMFIPHFYYNFYVFTYATGLTSGLAIADRIEKTGDKAAKQYIENLLSAGSSAPPLEILKSAGVDLETPAPILSMLDLFEQTVDEFDRIWTKTYGSD